MSKIPINRVTYSERCSSANRDLSVYERSYNSHLPRKGSGVVYRTGETIEKQLQVRGMIWRDGQNK